MGKFCANCGTALNESMTFCFNCGAPTVPCDPPAPTAAEVPAAPTTAETPVAPVTPAFIPSVAPSAPIVVGSSAPEFVSSEPEKPEKKTISKKALLIGGAFVVAVIAVAVILFIVLGSNTESYIDSPEAALDNFMALMHGDTSRIASIAPDGYWEWRAQKRDLTKEEIMEKATRRIINFPLAHMTARITKKTDVPIDTKLSLRNYFAKFVDNENCIQDMKYLTIEMTHDGKTEVSNDFIAVKISNNWYIFNVLWGTFGLLTF